MKRAASNDDTDPSQRISQYITELDDWRGEMLARLRGVILEARPDLVEEWKWGSPVWSHKGNVVSAGVFKDHLKLNFFKGASLEDPHGLFNAGFEAKATRGIDLYEGDSVSEDALQDLVRAAVAQNVSGGKSK